MEPVAARLCSAVKSRDACEGLPCDEDTSRGGSRGWGASCVKRESGWAIVCARVGRELRRASGLLRDDGDAASRRDVSNDV